MGGSRKNEEHPSLDISSLIDVSFLLLIYFLITSTLDPKESDLELSMLPDPGKGSAPFVIEHPTIGLNTEGVVFYETEVLDSDVDQRELVLLQDRLRMYWQASKLIDPRESPRVNFQVSDGARGQRLIDVMNCLAEVGISDVTFLDGEQTAERQ